MPCRTTVTGCPALVVADVSVVVGEVGVVVEQGALVIRLVSSVTAPLRASALPSSVAPPASGVAALRVGALERVLSPLALPGARQCLKLGDVPGAVIRLTV